MKRGFTMVELLAVTAILGGLALLALPSMAAARQAARAAMCQSNLRQMTTGYLLYMQDHEMKLFPWRENHPDGVLWYWGLEEGRNAEGERTIDRSYARLAPYLDEATVETCPSLPYHAAYFKRKFATATYGYGLNINLLADTPQTRAAGITSFTSVSQPGATVLWGDAAQVNRFQAPATPANPLLEEWYYVAAQVGELPTYHFRHQKRIQVAFADGSVKSRAPDSLLPYVDGLVGYLEPRGTNYFLSLRK